jgi:hypothetical protein
MAIAQNFRVAAKNYTQFIFKPNKEDVTWGGVYEKENIDKRTTTTSVFFARGNSDAAAGTAGTLVYQADNDPSTTLTFDWSVPWGLGETYLNVTVTGPIKLEKASFSEDEVLRKLVTIEIKDDAPLL